MKLNKLIALLLAVTMLFAFVGCPTGTNEPTPEPKPEPKPVDPDPVAPVTFTPTAGQVEEGTPIVLASETEGAVIYYEIVTGEATVTLSAENLTGESIKTYSDENKPVITGAATVYAIAVKNNVASDVTSAAYELPPLPIDWTTAPNIKDGLVSRIVGYVVNDVDGLKKLAEIVNGGKNLGGYTIQQTADITINESVLLEGFLEPAEGEGATANADLVNLDSIGQKDAVFAGTYDGNGKVIKGLYIYQGHQGLGFIGATGAGAVIKNVTITDACVINNNASGEADDVDDDRFGGLVGISYGATTIENCGFIGVIGSAAAKARTVGATGENPYEYAAGIIGRCDAATTVTNSSSLERNYAKAHSTATIPGGKNITVTDTVVIAYADVNADTDTSVIKNEAVKAAVEALKPAENPNPENPNPEDPNPENPNPEEPNPEEPAAAKDIKDGLVDGVTEYVVSDVAGLNKLAEIVNGGNTVAGYTFTVANDITINEAVLKDGFLEPDEGENATPNADLVNLDSIGQRKVPFCGTFDGNNKIISGLYIYQGHQGLAFIGEAGDGAVIKNVILRDACVINNNATGAADGPDDDRFGLLVGSSEYMDGAITVENCIVEGVVGSAAAKSRVVEGATGENPYEYAAGIMGEVGKKNTNMTVTIKNCVAFVRNYTKDTAIIINKDRITGTTGTGAIVQENNSAYGTDDLAAGKAAIDAAIAALTAPAADVLALDNFFE